MSKRLLFPLAVLTLLIMLTGCESTKERVSVPYVITGNRNSGSTASAAADTSQRREITTGVQAPQEAAPAQLAAESVTAATEPEVQNDVAPSVPLVQVDDFFTPSGESVPEYCLLAEGESPEIFVSADLTSAAETREAAYYTLLYSASYSAADLADYVWNTATSYRTPVALYSSVSRYEEANVLLYAPMDAMDMIYYSTIGIRCEDGESGAEVRTVFNGTPAEGVLQKGDLITEVNGSRVTDAASFKAVTDPVIDGSDRTVEITYTREGTESTVLLSL